MWGCLAASQRTVSRRKLWLIISEALRKRKGELVGSHDGLARLRRSENFHRYLLTFGLKHRQRSKGENIGAYVLAIFTVILEVFSFIHIRVSPTSKREFLRLIYFACQIMIGKVSLAIDTECEVKGEKCEGTILWTAWWWKTSMGAAVIRLSACLPGIFSEAEILANPDRKSMLFMWEFRHLGAFSGHVLHPDWGIVRLVLFRHSAHSHEVAWAPRPQTRPDPNGATSRMLCAPGTQGHCL